MNLSDIQGQVQPWGDTKRSCARWAIAAFVVAVVVVVVVVVLWLVGVIQSSSSSNNSVPSSDVSSSSGIYSAPSPSSGIVHRNPTSTPGGHGVGTGGGLGLPEPGSEEAMTCQAPQGWNGIPVPTCAINGTQCAPPPWAAQWSLTWSTVTFVSNSYSYWLPPTYQPWGAVALHWSNAQPYWIHGTSATSTCEGASYANANALKAQWPETRVYMYQNLRSPFLSKESNRVIMQNPTMQDYFIQYETGGQPDGQVYEYADGFLGTEYYWNWINSSAGAQFALSTVDAILENGMDGVFLDGITTQDAFSSAGMTSAQTYSLLYCMQDSEAQIQDLLVEEGVYAFNAFGYDKAVGPGIQATGPTQTAANSEVYYNCSYFMQVYCSSMSITTMLFSPQSPNQSVAAFLLGRGPNSYIGYPWEGIDAWGAWNSLFLLQVGKPQGGCTQVSSGVYSRAWTYGAVTLNCNTWQAVIPNRGVLWSPAAVVPTRWTMPLQGNLTEITTGGTGKALQFTETSSYYISEDDSFASTGRGVAWAATGQNYLAVYPTGGFLAPSYSQTFWVRLTAQSNAPITIVSSAPYANELSAPTATLNTEHFFLTYVLNNNLLAFVHGNVGYQHPLCSYSIPTSILFNYWLHVGVTFDSGTLTASLYVNGSLVNQTQSNPPYTGHALIHVGYFPDVSYSMEGYLQWLMWTNYALSSVEVQQAYQSTL
jgi:hypothetical protein